MKKIDVSVVLNMHREAFYLRPTLRSLEACAIEAQKAGLLVELIAVFDRADEATLAVFNTTPMQGFVAIKTTEVDFGSLGLARNAGVDLAEGEFVWTADGDDLASRNTVVELVNTARKHPNPNVVVFLEFLAAFGEQYHVARYVGTEWLTAADFAFHHPFVSRIFVRRSVFATLRYLDLKVTAGFAYEDWDLNCRLLAAGFDFVVAAQTVLFYRHRVGSLLQQANATSARTIPHGTLFVPDTYRKKMNEAHERVGDFPAFLAARRQFFGRSFAQELLASERMINDVIEASILDPEFEPARIESASSYCPIPYDDNHWGFQLERFYRVLGSQQFDDVVLLPWLKPGGAEKYILQVLHQLRGTGSAEQILVLSGESCNKHEWVRRLPSGTVFVDLFNAFPMLDDAGRDAMTVRALLAVSKLGARLHIKSGVFSHHLMDAYGDVLSSHFKIVYFRFSDSVYAWRGINLTAPWAISYLRRNFRKIDVLICDCSGIAERDICRFGTQQGKYKIIYSQCDSRPFLNIDRTVKHRLLWASRVAVEKRPELLGPIVKALRQEFPDLEIDLYGEIDACYDVKEIFGAPGLHYRGAFDGFDSLPIPTFDAFIYTSSFDGLPNIVLEAMGCGLPVIAPDIGGIGEAVVDSETGYLVPNIAKDDALIVAYINAVRKLYSNWDRTLEMAEAGHRLIAERHSETAFKQRVIEVFQPAKLEVKGVL